MPRYPSFKGRVSKSAELVVLKRWGNVGDDSRCRLLVASRWWGNSREAPELHTTSLYQQQDWKRELLRCANTERGA